MRVSLVAAGLVMQLGWVLLLAVSYVLSSIKEFNLTPEFTERFASYVPLLHSLDVFRPPSGEPTESGGNRPAAMLAMAIVVGLVSVGYLWGLHLLQRGAAGLRGAGRVIVGFGLLFQVTLLVMPGLFSTDLFSYILYGRIAGVYVENPYLRPPATFPQEPLVPWIRGNDIYPSPYGPLWTWITLVVARMLDPLYPLVQVLAFKVITTSVLLVNLGLVWWLAGRLGPGRRSSSERLTAWAACAWNPLLLLEIAANAHNDNLMLLFALLSLATLLVCHRAAVHGQHWTAVAPDADGTISRGQWVGALALIGASMLIKYATAILGLFYAVVWSRQLTSWRSKVVSLGGVGLLVLATSTVLFSPWLNGSTLSPMFAHFEGTGGLEGLGPLRANLATSVAERLVVWLSLDSETAQAVAIASVKLLPQLIFALYVGLEVMHLWLASPAGCLPDLEAVLRSSVRTLLLIPVLLLSIRFPWYFLVPIALASVLGWRTRFVKVVVAFSLIALLGYIVDPAPATWKPILRSLIRYVEDGLWLLLLLTPWIGRTASGARSVLQPPGAPRLADGTGFVACITSKPV